MPLHNQPALRALDARIAKMWLLGRQVVLCWSLHGTSLRLALLENHMLPRVEETAFELLRGESRRVDVAQFDRIRRLFPLKVSTIDLPTDIANHPRLAHILKKLIRRYSLSHTDRRAVALLDIVEFSLASQIEQVALLNSLAYSINIAERRCRQLHIDVDIGRTTTGDGFYLWNRNDGVEADANLFVLLMLALADNAIALRTASPNAVPRLRTCFTARSHFNFYQAEGYRVSDAKDYIVGEVTIELARLSDGARPGQILIGDFGSLPANGAGDRADAPTAAAAPGERPPPVTFIDKAQGQLDDLRGISLSHEKVTAIRAYLTGPPDGESYGISRYVIRDKHGFSHAAFNAKINIHCGLSAPIFLGLREADLAGFATEAPAGS